MTTGTNTQANAKSGVAAVLGTIIPFPPTSCAEEFAKKLQCHGLLTCRPVNGDPRGRNDVWLENASRFINTESIEVDPLNREAGGKIMTFYTPQNDRLQLDGVLPDVLRLLFNHRLPVAESATA